MIEQPSLCDDLIGYFETHIAKQQLGTTSSGRNLNAKDRVDINIAPKELNLPGNELLKTYMDCLFTCYKDYLVQWPFLREMGKKLEIGVFNLGRYQKGQDSNKCIPNDPNLQTLHRRLAWMTLCVDEE